VPLHGATAHRHERPDGGMVGEQAGSNQSE